MMTGQHPHRTGVWANVLPGSTLPDGTESWAPGEFSSHATALFGKAHIGNVGNGFLIAPLTTAGFDLHQGTFSALTGETYYNWTKVDSTLPDPYIVTIGIPGEAIGSETAANYATTVTMDDVITWVQAQVGDWLCVISLHAPHFPLHVPPAALVSAASQVRRTQWVASGAYSDANATSLAQAFSELMTAAGVPTDITSSTQFAWEAIKLAVEAADTEIDRLITTLEGSGDINLTQGTGDTTVWITCDNGSQSNFAIFPDDPNKAKTTVYDGGTLCPLILNGADVGDTGVCTELVSAVDVFETIAAIESVTLTGTRDGNDFSATLADVSASSGRTYSLSESFNIEGVVDFGLGENSTYTVSEGMDRALTNGTYKLLRRYDMLDVSVKRSELYRIDTDPFELNNLLRSNEETFESCGKNCSHYEGLRLLQREFDTLSPGL